MGTPNSMRILSSRFLLYYYFLLPQSGQQGDIGVYRAPVSLQMWFTIVYELDEGKGWDYDDQVLN
jgi:hypothetical protein